MMTMRYLSPQRTQIAKNTFSPLVWSAIRKHHFQAIMGENGQLSMQYLRPHNYKEAASLGVTTWFANRHVAEIHGFTGDKLSPNLMAFIASEMKKLRSQGVGIGAPENPKVNTAIAIRKGLSKFPEKKGTVKHTANNGVLGIASTATDVTVKHNTKATVKFQHGVVNHLQSSE